jgi:hypothetical protein
MNKAGIKYLPLLLLAAAFYSFINKPIPANSSYVSAYLSDTPFKQSSDIDIIADGAILQLTSNQFKFTKGPAADRDGNVYFSDHQTIRYGSTIQTAS